jgi:hypothetical protein
VVEHSAELAVRIFGLKVPPQDSAETRSDHETEGRAVSARSGGTTAWSRSTAWSRTTASRSRSKRTPKTTA